MLDWLKKNVSEARDKLSAEVTKFKNREFMDAVVNGCALVAAADGDISSSEKMKMSGFISNSPELKHFNMTDVIKSFNEATSKFEFDYGIGKAEALKTVGKIKSNETAARLLVRVCIAIGSADNNFDEKEKAVCRTICNELGLNPAEFEL